MRTPVPLHSCPPTASIETAPFLRLAVTEPSERERLCRGKQDERIWREERRHAPPSPCFKWQAREKLTYGGTRRELTNILWR
ncbi:hypothetical protein QQF64_032345 [Cirrhinus molitorella]|uniref:Uncharacterized protein n=1 Tax=Cirrhinus molitorella TaxID=172907 RepID=A0ABR3MZI0_9TELE